MPLQKTRRKNTPQKPRRKGPKTNGASKGSHPSQMGAFAGHKRRVLSEQQERRSNGEAEREKQNTQNSAEEKNQKSNIHKKKPKNKRTKITSWQG